MHQNVANKREAEHDVIFDPLEFEFCLQSLDSSLREGIPVDVVHDIHDNLSSSVSVTAARNCFVKWKAYQDRQKSEIDLPQELLLLHCSLLGGPGRDNGHIVNGGSGRCNLLGASHGDVSRCLFRLMEAKGEKGVPKSETEIAKHQRSYTRPTLSLAGIKGETKPVCPRSQLQTVSHLLSGVVRGSSMSPCHFPGPGIWEMASPFCVPMGVRVM